MTSEGGCVTAIAIDNGVERGPICVAAAAARGMTVVDLHGRLGREPNARVALELDAPRFWDLVVGSLERLA